MADELRDGIPPTESEDEFEVVEKTPGPPILWHSNAPWVGTGYGTQSGLFAPLIGKELGYDVAFSAFFGHRGRKVAWPAPHTGTQHFVYPQGRDSHGNDVLRAHATSFFAGRSGLVVFLSDPWVMKTALAASLPLVCWVPIDHDPVIPQTVDWFAKSGAYPVAMSRFGEAQLRDMGFRKVGYAPHGFDPNVFKPTERSEARELLGLPKDAFIVGMVAANVGFQGAGRKSFSEAFQAFAKFQKECPEAILYLHTLVETDNGDNLYAMAESLGIKFKTIDQYNYVAGMPDGVVAVAYNAFDVLLNPARGEGFGVPTLEAQACGTPCIVTDFSAMPEVAPASAGNWNVGGQRSWSQFESWQVIPNVDQIVDALVEAYEENEEKRTARRISVWQHAQQYDATRVTHEFWKPTLEEASAELAWRSGRMRRL